MAEYANDTYLASLATARGAIDRQVSNTLAEVGRQTDHGTAQAGLIPQTITGTNNAVKGHVNGTTGTMMGSLEKYGLAHPDLGMRQSVEQSHQGNLDRLQTVQDAWGRAAPLYAQGFQERGAQQAGRVSLIGQQLHADNDMARSNYVSGREAEDRQTAHQQSLADQSRQTALVQLAENARLERERIAAAANEGTLTRNHQTEQARLDRLADTLGINPLQPQPLSSTVGQMFLQYGGVPEGTSIQDIALVTGSDPADVLREIAVANDFHNNKRPITGAF